MSDHHNVVDLMNEAQRLRDTIDLLERNDRIQAKLLADTARERDLAVSQVERARKVIEPFAMLCRLDTKPEQSALDSVHPMVAVGRLRDALEYIDGLSHTPQDRAPK